MRISSIIQASIAILCIASAMSQTTSAQETKIQGTVIYPITPSPTRLGEERLQQHGEVNMAPDLTSTQDCKQFGANYVMIGITGRAGQGVDFLRVVCAAVASNGTVTTTTRRTDGWGGDAGTSYERICPAGQAVIGIRGTITNQQPRAIGLQCQKLTTYGLATGTDTYNLSYAGTANNDFGSSSFGPENCTQKRPARAMKVGKDPFHSGIPLGMLFAPIVVAMGQMICEQPQLP